MHGLGVWPTPCPGPPAQHLRRKGGLRLPSGSVRHPLPQSEVCSTCDVRKNRVPGPRPGVGGCPGQCCGERDPLPGKTHVRMQARVSTPRSVSQAGVSRKYRAGLHRAPPSPPTCLEVCLSCDFRERWRRGGAWGGAPSTSEMLPRHHPVSSGGPRSLCVNTILPGSPGAGRGRRWEKA